MVVEQMISSTKLQQVKSMAGSGLELQCSCDFKELLLEAVDAALSLLGDSSKQAIYFYLEKNFNLEKQDIPDRIEEFTIIIERLFGHGAKVLEIEIMKNLFVNVGSAFEYFPENGDLLFVEYVAAARIYVRACCH
jgi:hypothetical protein